MLKGEALDGSVSFGPPVLASRESEWFLGEGELNSCRQGDSLWIEGQDHLLVICQHKAARLLEQQTFSAYHDVLSSAGPEWKLCRVWNFIPGINQEHHSLENYRAFCAGRAKAFEQLFGAACAARMPAASGVGSDAGALTIAFLFSRFAPIHLENPRQVPAYQYPEAYGPRSPSFSRATICGKMAFISGTAAIEGYESIGIGDLKAQLGITLTNISEMLAMLASNGFNVGAARRDVVVYLRNPEDVAVVAASVDAHLLSETDRVVYLKADICRRELLVEIEMTLS